MTPDSRLFPRSTRKGDGPAVYDSRAGLREIMKTAASGWKKGSLGPRSARGGDARAKRRLLPLFVAVLVLVAFLTLADAILIFLIAAVLIALLSTTAFIAALPALLLVLLAVGLIRLIRLCHSIPPAIRPAGLPGRRRKAIEMPI